MAPSRLVPAIIVILLAGVTAVIPFHHDITRSYITTSDADLAYVYEALLLNDGLPQWNFDHPGYAYFLLLGLWIQLLYLIGILDVVSFSTMIALPAAEIDSAYGRLVVAGRGLAVLLSMLLVALVFWTVRRITRHDLAAALAALILATSLGVGAQSVILRPEILSVIFCYAAFLGLVSAAQAPEGRAEVLLGGSAFVAVLALATKIQAIFPLLGLPILALFFGRRQDSAMGPPPVDGKGIDLTFRLAALAMTIPAALMIVRAIQIGHSSGAYQAAIAGYIGLAIVTYGIGFSFPARRIINSAAASATGIALGLFFLLLRHDRNNTMVVVNLLDHMLQFAATPMAAGQQGLGAFVAEIGSSLAATLRPRLDVTSWLWSPFHLVEWIVLAGAGFALWRGRRSAALRSAALLGLALAIEVVFRLRGFPPRYRIYTDPWTATALGILIAAALEQSRWRAWRMTSSLAAAFGLIAVAGLHSMLPANVVPRDGPENACYQTVSFRPELARHFARYCAPARSP